MTIGILGGGQLARMIALAGYPLGLRFRVFDPAPDAPAGQLAQHVVAPYDDADELRKFAQDLDAITYEFENVPADTVRLLGSLGTVYPPAEALAVAQDRLAEKRLFERLGIPTPRFQPVHSLDDLRRAVAEIGLPAVLKTRRLGYDGKGQCVLRTASDVEATFTALSGAPAANAGLILEQFIAFSRELSLIAVRGADRDVADYPLVENVHRDGILRRSLAPAPSLTTAIQRQADEYANAIARELSYVGVLALELFDVDGRLLANEIAPRVHNSGHWSIEGAATSQFENHLRAILGWPLGDTSPRGASLMLNLIGEAQPTPELLALGGHVHLYAKRPAPGRKLGHVTFVAPNDAQRRAIIEQIDREAAAG